MNFREGTISIKDSPGCVQVNKPCVNKFRVCQVNCERLKT